jgi:CheY-like chemotaxis protein
MNPVTAEGESPVGEEAFTPMARAQAGAGDPSPLQELGKSLAASGVAMAGSPLSQSPSTVGASGPVTTGSERPLLALVVDDDPLTRKLMGRMMTRLGCTVEETENGQLFLDILLGNPEEGKPPRYFDIVTLDNAMPVLTGEQAIRELRKAGRSDLIVGATGNALKSDQNAYIAVGRLFRVAQTGKVADITVNRLESTMFSASQFRQRISRLFSHWPESRAKNARQLKQQMTSLLRESHSPPPHHLPLPDLPKYWASTSLSPLSYHDTFMGF